jgi:hypothetical protein
MIKSSNGIFRADKVQYEDGIGCCVWYPAGNGDDENMGLCWDFGFSNIDELINLLKILKHVEAEPCEPTTATTR